jgi:CMP-N,N'-diacetyllegionaminic acid synthase
MKSAKCIAAIIPARGGSKRLPRKNVKKLNGMPLIAHTIIAALGSKKVNHVFVSTEDREIAAIAEEFGATVSIRPERLAEDNVQNSEVIAHFLNHVTDDIDCIVLLQPTSPLRNSDDIDNCLALFEQENVKSVSSVTSVDYHPYKSFFVDEKQLIALCFDENKIEARHQDLPVMYRQNGAIHVVGVSDFLSENRFVQRPCKAYVMPMERSVDIDNERDLILAATLLNSNNY